MTASGQSYQRKKARTCAFFAGPDIAGANIRFRHAGYWIELLHCDSLFHKHERNIRRVTNNA